MVETPVRLYIPRNYMVSELSYIPLLFPYLGAILKDSNPYVSAAFKDYGFTTEGFILSDSPKDADYIVVPHIYLPFKTRYPEKLAAIIAEARENEKPLLIDGSGDIEASIPFSNVVVLRIGQYRFKARDNEITIPVPAEDLLETSTDGILRIRNKGEKAILGFSGWASMPFWTRMKALVKGIPYRLLGLIDSRYRAYEKGALMRIRAINILQKATRIVPHFIIRTSYSAHEKTIQGDFKTVRQEFIDNLLESDYALSIRGDANADTRFYEAISLGKIPVLVDSERMMPLEDDIDYASFCLRVDFRDISRIETILADFHASLTNDQFRTMQQKAREIFVEYLRTNSFTPHLARLLRNRLKKI